MIVKKKYKDEIEKKIKIKLKEKIVGKWKKGLNWKKKRKRVTSLFINGKAL